MSTRKPMEEVGMKLVVAWIWPCGHQSATSLLGFGRAKRGGVVKGEWQVRVCRHAGGRLSGEPVMTAGSWGGVEAG